MSLIRLREQRLFDLRDPPLPVLSRRSDERLEQRVRLHRLALEFRMELASEKPGMIRDLADLDVRIIGRLAGDPQPRRL